MLSFSLGLEVLEAETGGQPCPQVMVGSETYSTLRNESVGFYAVISLSVEKVVSGYSSRPDCALRIDLWVDGRFFLRALMLEVPLQQEGHEAAAAAEEKKKLLVRKTFPFFGLRSLPERAPGSPLEFRSLRCTARAFRPTGCCCKMSGGWMEDAALIADSGEVRVATRESAWFMRWAFEALTAPDLDSDEDEEEEDEDDDILSLPLSPIDAEESRLLVEIIDELF